MNQQTETTEEKKKKVSWRNISKVTYLKINIFTVIEDHLIVS